MQAANPYLMFDGNAEEAFAFYKSLFGGEFAVKVRFKDMGGGPPGATPAELERIAHVALPIGRDDVLMGSDIIPSLGHTLIVGNNFHLGLSPESSEEADRLFRGLSAGGTVLMEPRRTEWAEKHGMCVDRFGIQWMVTYTGSVQFAPGNAA